MEKGESRTSRSALQSAGGKIFMVNPSIKKKKRITPLACWLDEKKRKKPFMQSLNQLYIKVVGDIWLVALKP